MANCLSGPKCASIGLAQEAQVGVKHSSTLCFGPSGAYRCPCGGEVVHDHVDRGAVGRAARIDVSAASVSAAPFLRRLTPHRRSYPTE